MKPFHTTRKPRAFEPYYLIMPFSYGVALERRGQSAAAIEQFQRVLVHFPNHLDAQHHIAENQARLGAG